jgi:hypothetical protein
MESPIIRWTVSVVACISLFLHGQGLQAQASASSKEKDWESTVTRWIESRHFEFVARQVLPNGGATRILTTDYFLRLKADTLESYLPYFGRVYSTDPSQTNGDMEFKSLSFDYQIKPGKKGGWEIRIKTKDLTQDSYTLMLSAFSDGNASLQITSIKRDPISYQGYLRAVGK